jgi:site-specific DNA-cytosine methylase
MKVLGVFGGIGSMMIGAKQQGYEIIGNIEDRQCFFTGTFEENYPGAFMVSSINELTDEQIEMCKDVDLILGHPKCGSFSSLRHQNNTLGESRKELAGNFSKFIDSINKFKPKFFAIDNLPKSLTEFTYKDWSDKLPDYDIHFEYISNRNYGNVQLRKRLFIIGSLKKLGFYFIPSEFENNETLLERISKIPHDAPNHQQWKKTDIVEGWYRHEFVKDFVEYKTPEDKITYEEFGEFLKNQKLNKPIECYNKKREITSRIGKSVIDINGMAKTVTGGNTGHHYQFRSDTFMPFTIRERAKIGGCPDDFIFLPNQENEIKSWHNDLIHQTGKFMPVEFTTFLTQQIKDFLECKRDETKYTNKRLVKSKEEIDENKYQYCKNIGYSNQQKVCEFCGSKEYCKKQK